eukprot:TRINITY_DN8568_c0_g1_i2.p1 TRINITY_DN8568_c0_g1~~TRINITY_DN8568_c0_g1_i2.p1  ORF type:complete len:241 (-),score=30.15 TRINITY_DN8568_c0_g1_i2:33-698(-)
MSEAGVFRQPSGQNEMQQIQQRVQTSVQQQSNGSSYEKYGEYYNDLRPNTSSQSQQQQQQTRVIQTQQTQQAACIPMDPIPTDDEKQVSREVNHKDGKVEKWFKDGRRLVQFSNGTCKVQFEDGRCEIRFANGDIKKTTPDGKTEYYYKEVQTWHATFPSDIEVFYFSNGQIEGHHKNGSKEIVFPDGSLRKVDVGGSERDLAPKEWLKRSACYDSMIEGS